MSARAAVPAMFLAVVLAGCSLPRATGVMDVAERPAERAFLAGLHAYEDAQYDEAERQFNAALRAGLVSPRDRAAAYKYLAFIFCTSRRLDPCEDAFRSARAADRNFVLSKSEAGHPVWGPVYRRLFP